MPDPKGPPNRIWLQWHGDEAPGEDGKFHEPDPCHEDVTWCQDKIFEHDVEYAKTSALYIAVALLAEYNELVERCGVSEVFASNHGRIQEFLESMEANRT